MKSGTTELMKFKRLQRRLRLSKLVTTGLLELLWQATAKNAPQGDIGRFSNEDIAIECDYDGDPDEMVDALVGCDWIDECADHRLVIHDWHEHCPTYIKGNLAKHKKQLAIARCPEQAAETIEQAAIASCSGHPSTKPSLAYPNQDTSASAEVCADPPPEAAESTPPSDEPTEFEFPVSGKNQKPWVLPRSKLDEYVNSFPGIDVRVEIRKARQWIRDHPTRRKTPTGMLGFLTRWLGKAQNERAVDRGGTKPGRGPVNGPGQQYDPSAPDAEL